MTASWATALPNGVRLAVQVTPNARKTEVVGVVEVGVDDYALKIKLQAQPVEGQANAALLKWLAAQLKVGRGAVVLIRGETSRRKVVKVRGVTLEQVLALV